MKNSFEGDAKKVDHGFEFTGRYGLNLFRPLVVRRISKIKTPDLKQVAFVSYADDSHRHKGGRFCAQQDALVRQVKSAGINQIFPLRRSFLEQCPEYQNNPAYFDQHAYRNGHAFKPVVLKRVVESLPDGTHLFYSDCRKFNISSAIEPLLKLNAAYGNVIAQYGDANIRWTKNGAFKKMGCDNSNYWLTPHLQDTWFLFKIDARFRSLLDEWAFFNCDPEVAEYLVPGQDRSNESPYLQDNRGDQSILTNLCLKYGYKSSFAAGFGANKSPALFVFSMLTGSRPCLAFWRARGRRFL